MTRKSTRTRDIYFKFLLGSLNTSPSLEASKLLVSLHALMPFLILEVHSGAAFAMKEEGGGTRRGHFANKVKKIKKIKNA